MTLYARTLRGRLATAAAASALALGLPALAVAQEQVRIGATFGLTGGLAPYSPSLVDAARMLVEEVNGNGGILDGRELSLTILDDQTNPQAAVDAAQRLVMVENVAAILGPFGSAQVMAVANAVTVPNSILQIAPTATTPALTDLEDDDFVFRVVVSDAYLGQALAEVALERGHSEVALLYAGNDYGVGLANTFRAAFAEGGGTLTGDLRFEPQRASYRGELASIAAGSDTLVLIGYPADGGNTILRQALENGFFSDFILTDGMRDASVIAEIGGDFLEGSWGMAPEAPPETEAAQRFTAAYEAFSEHPTDSLFIKQTYDAAMLLALAIEKAGSTDRVAIRDALRAVSNPPGEQILPGEWARARELIAAGQDIDFFGASGPHDFDENGDVAGTIGVFEVRDGAFVTIEVREP